jgi:predicted nucleic acid-binding protein
MAIFASKEQQPDKVVSVLARVEATSAICRMRQRKLIDAARMSQALDALALKMHSVVEQPIDKQVLLISADLIVRYNLRALDGVQLASALVARLERAGSEMRFIASDNALLEAARREGFQTWDPAD